MTCSVKDATGGFLHFLFHTNMMHLTCNAISKLPLGEHNSRNDMELLGFVFYESDTRQNHRE